MKVKSMSEIGKLIKQERKRQGVLQRDLAELSGVSGHFLSNLENGKETVEFKKILQVFRALGISIQIEPRSRGGEI